MVRRNLSWFFALALIASVPALAGHDGKKCDMNTQDCLNAMAANMKNTGWIGVELDVDEASGLFKVERVVPDSPAEAAGIKAGDVLYAMNGIKLGEENEKALKKAKQGLRPGSSVTYTIKRDGYDRDVKLTLAPMPTDVMAKWIGKHMMEHATAEVAAK